MRSDETVIAAPVEAAQRPCAIVLQPLAHPELGEIRIDEDLFAIGRAEMPFVDYPADVVADLSRRHARIFFESGAAYIADIDSKNGTCVNGVAVRQKITRLRDGDEISFGRKLKYRVRLQARALPPRAAALLSVTLTPERGDLGLQPVVITQFPFLISKAEQTFARYRDSFPHQVNFLSRRHAHIFLKGGLPFVEDLGSTNGTFVGGKRLDEHALELREGDTLAFGGHHFVYRVFLQRQQENKVTDLATVTVFSAGGAKEEPVVVESQAETTGSDKTTFVAAADSFLNIFCVDPAQRQEDELNEESGPAERVGKSRRGATLLSEIVAVATGTDRAGMRRIAGRGLALLALPGLLALVFYLREAPERELKKLMEGGQYAAAATLASKSLERDPDNAELKAMSTEALLKAKLPPWAAAVKARQFDRAGAILAEMKMLAARNGEVQPFVGELEWINGLEQFVSQRGGAEAPVSGSVDAERIRQLLRQWEDETQAHQRAFVTISSYVPEFRDTYAEALSHLRKLALTGGRNDRTGPAS